MTIDMKNYAGEIESPAAVEQQGSYNSYQNEQEYPVPLPPVEEATPVEPEVVRQQEATPPKEDPQALNFKALQDSVERLKAERESEKQEHQLQLDMLRANFVQKQQVQEAPQAKQMFDGMQDGDVPNVGELRKAWNEREAAYNQKIEELQVASKYPDYAEVLTKHGKHLAETDPVFLQGLRGSENKAMFAYQYAKREARLQELEAQLKNKVDTPPQSNNAQKIVENARKPGTLAQAGGQSVLSQANYYETMSDNEFMKFANKHLEGI
jgi:hypothetical protein